MCADFQGSKVRGQISEVGKKYRFITITRLDDKCFGIYNNRNGERIAVIEYYSAWKQYVFSTEGEQYVFNKDCLRDILDFIENEIPAITAKRTHHN